MRDPLRAAIAEALRPERDDAVEHGLAAPPRPAVQFEPSLLADPRVVSTSDPMVQGVREHLRRYGNHQSSKSALTRIEDAAWLEAWDAA
jgi:hypothetical protein